eukprot:TRINITY_DN32375_c0_g1_i1.p1 TRINITY_DN32375_c0_g1~~TRINITY_DN32375_c0_g1_i1.p1  ORF type:complete len:721 (+),score=66.34 TRINITY_DN32375_c0_g1_i1:24-2186(+)
MARLALPCACTTRIILLLFVAAAALALYLRVYSVVGAWNPWTDSPLVTGVFPKAGTTRSKADTGPSHCDRVAEARSKLPQFLHSSYPCESLPPARSAVVTMITAGVEAGKTSRVVFSRADYVEGALALGASLRKHSSGVAATAAAMKKGDGGRREDGVHMLLLVREGFSLDPREEKQLKSVGWIIGTAPKFELQRKYVPRFPRYATTYTKVAAIGLSEYECVLLMDADTLAVGSIDNILDCSLFDAKHPEQRVAGALDYYQGRWMHFNTGSLLYRTDAAELKRVHALTRNETFMKQFQSDQIFLNNVYPERTNVKKNQAILAGADKGWEVGKSVVTLPFEANAQTHIEVQLPSFWADHLPGAKIFHFTEKKGWQCPRTYDPPAPVPAPSHGQQGKCDRKEPTCFCREGYRYWRALRDADAMLAEADAGNAVDSGLKASNAQNAAEAHAPAMKPESDGKDLARGERGHQCLNEDFKPVNSVAVWTMLNDNPQHVLGALKMGRGVKAHTKTPLDLVVMELKTKPLSESLWKDLSQVGFLRCVVGSIPPPNEVTKTRWDLREKFAVLHVWAMTVYSTVVFLDADTYVRASIDHLFTMNLGGKPLGVTRDIRSRKWVDTFNSGVMVLRPSKVEYDSLIRALNSGLTFDFVMADQGFLNEIYKNNWHEIGFVNNANLALYKFQREFWDQHKLEDINVIHFTMQKPWTCRPSGPYGPLCKLWLDAK